MSAVVMGVDASFSATGVCAVAAGGPPELGLAKTKTVHGSLAKLTRMEGIACAITRWHPEAALVLLEAPSFASKGSATRDLAGLWWLVLRDLLRREVPVGVVPPSVLKKWVTGSGNASKFVLGQHIGKRWPGVELRDDNEADALGLASMGLQHLGQPAWRPTAYQTEQIQRVEWIDPATRGATPCPALT